jgi:hypothetical protein
MTTRTISTRIALALPVVSSTFASPAFAAATTVRDASAALSFWVAWGLVYLGVGVVLLRSASVKVARGRRCCSGPPTKGERRTSRRHTRATLPERVARAAVATRRR